MDLNFYNYNNYYNRIFKKETSIADYGTPALVISDVQGFTPGDGVDTTHAINLVPYNITVDPDYLIVTEGNAIISRWFIIDSNYTRKGQYIVSLHRDLIADYYDEVINTPCFIEKATLNAGDPGIFNSENMTFNQIKQSETLLKDVTESAWIVGYYAKNTDEEQLTGELPAPVTDTSTAIGTTFENWQYYTYTQGTIFKTNVKPTEYTMWANDHDTFLWDSEYRNYARLTATLDIKSSERISGRTPSLNVEMTSDDYTNDDLVKAFSSTMKSYAPSVTVMAAHLSSDVNNKTASETATLLTYNNKTIVDTNGKHYKIKIERRPISSQTVVSQTSTPLLYDDIKGAVYNNGWKGRLAQVVQGTINPVVPPFSVTYTYEEFRVTAEPVQDLDIHYTIVPLDSTSTPYNMFAIPYGPVKVRTLEREIITSKEYALQAAQQIAINMGSNLYDIQLLPYCPLITEDPARFAAGGLNLNTAALDPYVNYMSYTPIGGTEQFVGVILNVTSPEIHLEIPFNYQEIDSNKVAALCNMHRIVSPNYSGQFEFNAFKNGGLTKFDVDATYKPFSPYIHINPDFGALYGSDFNDARGLICGGDFSLPILSDAWIQYQIENKNFQNIFDRQIENMEDVREIERRQQVFGAVTGTITGGAVGAMAGAKAGPYGAIAGAVAGTALGAVGGAMDVINSDKLFELNKQYTIDQFGYKLDNIKALPYSLTRVTSLNANNKIWPFVEFYTCTDEEKRALNDKVKYNGMTVMRIGTIAEYQKADKSYIKGRIIRFADDNGDPIISDDFHLCNCIAEEIYRGVFI